MLGFNKGEDRAEVVTESRKVGRVSDDSGRTETGVGVTEM